jgi:hypothetical protein
MLFAKYLNRFKRNDDLQAGGHEQYDKKALVARNGISYHIIPSPPRTGKSGGP